MKVILIQGLLAPYRYPIFEELSKTPGWDFSVWFMGRKVKNRIWDEEALKTYHFTYSFLRGFTLNLGVKDNYPIWFNFSIFRQLRVAKPDAVIMMGWDSLTSFLVHLYCALTNTPFILYSDSTSMEKSWRRLVTLPLVKLHTTQADAMIAGGSKSKLYLEELGVNPQKIFVSFNTVDVEKYQDQANSFREVADDTRAELSFKNQKIILFYGQLIVRKGVDLLLASYQQLKKTHPDLALLIIGDGPLRTTLERDINKQEIADVQLLSNPGDDVISKYYAIASVFVLPSREDVWGLVVNEAMAAGLPVVVSDHAGSAEDLVSDGQQGFVFKSGSVTDLTSKIEKIISNDSLRQEMSRQALQRITLFTPALTIGKFQEAVESVFKKNRTSIQFTHDVKPGLVSVITPEHADQPGLEKTLQSLRDQQDAPAYELIVEHDIKGVGSYQTRNQALTRSQGEYLAFIDAGTIASPNWLKQGVADLQTYDYIGGPIERDENHGAEVSLAAYLFGKHREFPVAEFMSELHFAPTTNLFTKRAVVEKLGGFNPHLISSGDLEFGTRVYNSALFTQHYDPALQVTHPFRTYHQLIEKQKRVAKGQAALHHSPPVLELIKAIAPPVWLLRKPSFQPLSWSEKILVFFVTYHLNLIHHLSVIRHGQVRER